MFILTQELYLKLDTTTVNNKMTTSIEATTKCYFAACAYYRLEPHPKQLDVYVALLAQTPPEKIVHAFNAHLSDPEAGRWFPTVAHLVAKMDGTLQQAIDDAVSNCLTKWETNNLTEYEQDKRRKNAAQTARQQYNSGKADKDQFIVGFKRILADIDIRGIE